MVDLYLGEQLEYLWSPLIRTYAVYNGLNWYVFAVLSSLGWLASLFAPSPWETKSSCLIVRRYVYMCLRDGSMHHRIKF